MSSTERPEKVDAIVAVLDATGARVELDAAEAKNHIYFFGETVPDATDQEWEAAMFRRLTRSTEAGQ